MNYTQLTADDQARMLAARLNQYTARRAQAVAQAAALPKDADPAALTAQINDLDKTIPATEDLLAALPAGPALLTQALKHAEQQHYDATLNLQMLPGTTDGTDVAIAAVTALIADLDKTIPPLRAKVAALPTPAAPGPPGPPRPS